MMRSRKSSRAAGLPARSLFALDQFEPRLLMANILGTVFNDLDGDAVKDGTEPGLSGWTVYLDTNDNSVLDSGEASTVSGATGTYSFTGLSSGTYRLRQISQPGWMLTLPWSGVYQFTLATPSSTASNRNWGNVIPGNINGFVFADYDSDGTKDGNEPGLSGWTVYLDTNNDSMLDPTETQTTAAANGSYSFPGLRPGQYTVREIVPAGWAQTVPGSGGMLIANPPAPPSEPVAEATFDRQISPGEIIVAFDGNQGLPALRRRRGDRRILGLFDLTRSQNLFTVQDESLVQIALPKGIDPVRAADAFSQLPGVKWAQPNYIYTGDPREFTPNDPSYPSQYHHTLMQNNLAWNTTLGSSNVIIAITDDGVSLGHSDLAPNIWVNSDEIAGNGIDDDNNGFIDDRNGWDFSDGDNDPNPGGSAAHGTHVAGIAGARTNNANGVAGTAGGATIMPIRFIGGANAWTSTLIAASWRYAVDNGAKIISDSYNIDSFVGDSIFTAGLQYVYDHGVLHFNSAGNSSTLNPVRQAFDQTLLVVNTNSSDTKASTSNYGWGMDITAPGENIYSTIPGNNYAFNSGTSMASPNAAAAAALIWSVHPTWTRDQVAAQLIGTADNLDALNPSYAGLLGPGRANSYRGVTQTLAAPKIKSVLGLPAQGVTTTTVPTSFTLDVANVFNPATVNVGAFELRGDGADNLFGTSDDTTIPLVLHTNYMVGTNRLSFSLNGTATPDTYRFTALPTLADPFGQSLDGNGNGTGGDAFTRSFTIIPMTNPYEMTVVTNQTTGGNFGNRDTTGPEIVNSWFEYDARQAIHIVLSENVQASLGSGDLIVQLNGTGPAYAGQWNYNTQTNTATFTFQNGLILPDGNFIATVQAAGITDLFGNTLVSEQSESGPDTSIPFFVFAGDANHDRTVNVLDMYNLSLNWMGSGKTFAQGDFNYDGVVNATDLGIVGTRWLQTLPAPSQVTASLTTATPPTPTTTVRLTRMPVQSTAQLVGLV